MYPVIYTTIPKYGYGDILVGLVSTFLIAKKLHKKFIITFGNDTTDIFQNIPFVEFHNSQIINLLNPESETKAQHFIEFNKNEDRKQIIISNQPWHKLIYKNDKQLIKDTLRVYKHVYTHLLKPTAGFIKRANNIMRIFKKPIIGIQVRCGDYSWDANDDNIYLKNRQFKYIIQRIIIWVNRYGVSKNVYLTSDNKQFIQLADKLLKHNDINVYTLLKDPVHFKDTKNIYETIMDHYILSHCTQFLISKEYSNYGLTAALISGNDNIWAFNEKYSYISKINLNEMDSLFKY
jgi:hypothetical protein